MPSDTIGASPEFFIVPPGMYYLCDPCWAASSTYIDAHYAEVFQYSFGTAYGDGRYYDQHGTEYGVDSGRIGLVPVDTPDDDVPYLQGRRAALFRIEFTVPTRCESAGGNMWFGSIHIDTRPHEEVAGPFVAAIGWSSARSAPVVTDDGYTLQYDHETRSFTDGDLSFPANYCVDLFADDGSGDGHVVVDDYAAAVRAAEDDLRQHYNYRVAHNGHFDSISGWAVRAEIRPVLADF